MMRVVNRDDFLKLASGTIYCKGAPWAFGELCIKGDSLENDWIYLNLAWPAAKNAGEASDILHNSLETGASFLCEDAWGWDGCFDQDAVFLIFERADLHVLKHYVDNAP